MTDICIKCHNYYYHCECNGANMLGFAEKIEYIDWYEAQKGRVWTRRRNMTDLASIGFLALLAGIVYLLHRSFGLKEPSE